MGVEPIEPVESAPAIQDMVLCIRHGNCCVHPSGYKTQTSIYAMGLPAGCVLQARYRFSFDGRTFTLPNPWPETRCSYGAKRILKWIAVGIFVTRRCPALWLAESIVRSGGRCLLFPENRIAVCAFGPLRDPLFVIKGIRFRWKDHGKKRANIVRCRILRTAPPFSG